MANVGPRGAAAARSQAATASKDFPKGMLVSLLKKGMRITGTTWLPDSKGNYSNGERGYLIDDNGTQRIRTYLGVMALAGW